MTAAARHAAGLAEVLDFLHCGTPDVWFEQAAYRLDLLLVDHAHCEKKAASTALAMLYRYVDRPELLRRLSRLAREELRHFEQVHALLQRRGIAYVHLTPSRYAAALMDHVRPDQSGRLVDTLLIGAVVEARSCERFAGLVNVLPDDVAELYAGLLASEARHFRQYLDLAERYGGRVEVSQRLPQLLETDAALVTRPDIEFRFHSGPLAA